MLRSLFIFSSCSLCGRIRKNKSRNAKGQTPSKSILLNYSQFLNLTSHALQSYGKTGNKQHVTCFATLLQNKLQSDVACFTTRVKPVFHRLVPSHYLSVFWAERRLGIRLRRAIFPSSLPMRPRAHLNLIPSLLSPQKTLK